MTHCRILTPLSGLPRTDVAPADRRKPIMEGVVRLPPEMVPVLLMLRAVEPTDEPVTVRIDGDDFPEGEGAPLIQFRQSGGQVAEVLSGFEADRLKDQAMGDFTSADLLDELAKRKAAGTLVFAEFPAELIPAPMSTADMLAEIAVRKAGGEAIDLPAELIALPLGPEVPTSDLIGELVRRVQAGKAVALPAELLPPPPPPPAEPAPPAAPKPARAKAAAK